MNKENEYTEKRNEREKGPSNLTRQVDKDEIPPQFEAATNQLQICNWLVAHPNILKLANEMLAASSASTSSTSTLSTSSSSVSDNVSTRFDYFDIFWHDFFIDIYFIFFLYFVILG